MFSFSPQLILQFTVGVIESRGFNFSGGGRGSRVQVLISIETHITCDFPGGGGGGGGPDPLSPPLDPHMVSSPNNSTSLHV